MTQVLTHVTNTVTNAVTTFDNYPFNSFATFQGKSLGAGPNGLYLIDNAASVEKPVALFTTAQLHFGTVQLKRLSDLYIGMRSEGDITIRILIDEQDPYEYLVKTYDIERLNQRRAWIGKGARGKYWQLQFEMSEYFDFDNIDLAAVLLSRRI